MRFRFLLFTLFFSLFLSSFAQDSTNACYQSRSIRIVVLGSSTAEGVGPSDPDSAWVNRYRKYVQTLHADNEVINLAKSGYTTYHLLPDGYSTPANRPAPDTLRNISQALSLNPDAIIVNMPSNDAYNYYGTNEQVPNFATIYDSAVAHQVPMWICTPQPRNFDPVRIQIQRDLRDSILTRYGNFAIDFWAGIAQSNGDIEPVYNPGDGIHLNNAGHYVLFHRVKNAGVPAYLFQPGAGYDYFVFQPFVEDLSLCGEKQMKIQVPVGNIGASDNSLIPIQFDIINDGIPWQISDNLPTGLATCTADTFSFFANTYPGGKYELSVKALAPLDADTSNNRQEKSWDFIGHPEIAGWYGEVCDSGSVRIQALASFGDSVVWYDSATGGSPIHVGNVFHTPFIDSTKLYYAEGVRGELFYRNQLLTTTESDKTWNGAMFDFIGKEDITIDSLAIRVNNLGFQKIMIYLKPGGHRGFENDPTAWTLHDSVVVWGVRAGSFVMLPITAFNLAANDTIACYIHLQNPQSRLLYNDANQAMSHSNAEVEILSGSGITHTFGQVYFPREMNIKMYYHHGFRAEGDCTSDRIAITALVQDYKVNLGPDTTLLVTDSIHLRPPLPLPDPTQFTYLWSNGWTGYDYFADGKILGLGTHCFWLESQQVQELVSIEIQYM